MKALHLLFTAVLISAAASQAGTLPGLDESRVNGSTVSDGTDIYNILKVITPVFSSDSPVIYIVEHAGKIAEAQKSYNATKAALEEAKAGADYIRYSIADLDSIAESRSLELRGLIIRKEQMETWRAKLEESGVQSNGIIVSQEAYIIMLVLGTAIAAGSLYYIFARRPGKKDAKEEMPTQEGGVINTESGNNHQEQDEKGSA